MLDVVVNVLRYRFLYTSNQNVVRAVMLICILLMGHAFKSLFSTSFIVSLQFSYLTSALIGTNSIQNAVAVTVVPNQFHKQSYVWGKYTWVLQLSLKENYVVIQWLLNKLLLILNTKQTDSVGMVDMKLITVMS